MNVGFGWMIAAVTNGSPAPWGDLGQYGVLGVAVLTLGWVVLRLWTWGITRSDQMLARETERADRLEAENRAQNLVMQEKVLPTVLAAVDAIKECTTLLRDLARERERERDNALRRRDGG